ncbi:MAG TPA: YafY family protein, partial [Anaerolineae bacterium]|nr:YafY family protein [Anaerolineae bacterium]
EDLARTFEVNKRTIYRDVQALSEMGVPVVAVPGQGYALMEGYFLPPLRFTTDEATMLSLGAEFVGQHFDAQYRAAALSATRKLEAVLPEPLRAEVGYLQENIRFVAQNEPSGERAQHLALIRRALIERKTIQFEYHARFGDERRPLPQRTVNPFAIVNIDNVWYLVGYDHARRGIRHFRLERVSEVQVLGKTFERPKQFQMNERGESGRNLRIRALFDAEVARWVREASNFYVTAMEDTREGLLVTLEVRQAQEVLPWLLSWGGHVRVVEPEAVKELVRGEAERIVEMYTA